MTGKLVPVAWRLVQWLAMQTFMVQISLHAFILCFTTSNHTYLGVASEPPLAAHDMYVCAYRITIKARLWR